MSLSHLCPPPLVSTSFLSPAYDQFGLSTVSPLLVGLWTKKGDPPELAERLVLRSTACPLQQPPDAEGPDQMQWRFDAEFMLVRKELKAWSELST